MRSTLVTLDCAFFKIHNTDEMSPLMQKRVCIKELYQKHPIGAALILTCTLST